MNNSLIAKILLFAAMMINRVFPKSKVDKPYDPIYDELTVLKAKEKQERKRLRRLNEKKTSV